MSVTVKNIMQTPLAFVIAADPETHLERVIQLAAAATVVIDDVVASASPDLYLKIAEKKLSVTVGSMPVANYNIPLSDVGNLQPESGQASAGIVTHAALTTGVHGVGAGTVAKVADIADNTKLSVSAQAAITASHGVNAVNSSAEASGATATHAALATGVHGVGAGTVAKVADIADNTKLSVSAQAAITASHGVNAVNSSAEASGATATHAALTTGVHGVGGGTIAKQGDDLAKIVAYESAVSIGGGGATESLAVTGLLGTDTILSVVNSTAGATPANSVVAGYGAPGAGTLSVTWIGDPGAGAKVTVLVKKA